MLEIKPHWTDEFGKLWIKFCYHFPSRKLLKHYGFDIERMLLLAPVRQYGDSDGIWKIRENEYKNLFNVFGYSEEQVEYITMFSRCHEELCGADSVSDLMKSDYFINQYLKKLAVRFTKATNFHFILNIWGKRLKPCPFCGEIGKIYYENGSYLVCCRNTGLWDKHHEEMKFFREGKPFYQCPAFLQIPSQPYIERAVRIWNTRKGESVELVKQTKISEI